MKEKLKPCPFNSPCIGEGKIMHNADIWYVFCKNCGRHTNSYQTRAEAIKAWNRRPK